MEYNNLNKSTLSYIKKYKLAQKIYLPIIEKTIEQKILYFNFDFPNLDNSLNNTIDEENKSRQELIDFDNKYQNALNEANINDILSMLNKKSDL